MDRRSADWLCVAQDRPDVRLLYTYIYVQILKLVVCILLRVLGQVQGFRLAALF
jgi:hypothetical protein